MTFSEALSPIIQVSNVCAYTQPGDAGSNAKDCIAEPAGGFLSVVKVADPDDSTEFPFTINNGTEDLFTPTIIGSGASTRYSVLAGTYSVSEAVPDGWQLDNAVCDDGTSTWVGTTVSAITVNPSDDVTCTFSDSKQTGSLTLVKEVVNDNGGSATVADFELSTSAGDLTWNDVVTVEDTTHVHQQHAGGRCRSIHLQ